MGADFDVVELIGDYNLNGTVDAEDYTVWKSSFRMTVAPYTAGNGDGVVDAADYTVWRNNLGATLPAAAGLAFASEHVQASETDSSDAPEPEVQQLGFAAYGWEGQTEATIGSRVEAGPGLLNRGFETGESSQIHEQALLLLADAPAELAPASVKAGSRRLDSVDDDDAPESTEPSLALALENLFGGV